MLRHSPRRSGCLALRALQGVLAGLAVAVGLHFALVLGGPNFHTVLPGRVYRSAQLSPGQLERYVRAHGIRTVINLRGCCVTAKWYRQQCEALARLDVAQEDLPFSAVRMPAAPALRQLVEAIERSEPPVLLHCHQGADRTGLASVLALLLLTDTPLDDAVRQLGPSRGHVPLGRTANVGRLVAQYRAWLGETGQDHSPGVFRRWAFEEYCPAGGRAEFELIEPSPRPGTTDVQVRPGEMPRVMVRCRNASRTDWQFEPGVTAGTHGFWRVIDRDERLVASGRTGLRRATVAPGESIDLAVPLPPLPPGRYWLFLDLVEEQHASFLQLGNELFAAPVEVR